MFSGMQTAHDPKMIGRIPKDLPILIVSGSDDPVGDFGKGVKTVKNQLNNAAKRLGLNRTRDLIKIFSVYNITLWE